MSNEPEDERAYLLRRADQHRATAAAATDPAHRALHERFAAIYHARATSGLVQEN